jgi:nucleotide-binding universal stress UspA family protein
MGSVTEKVLRKASCPVMTVPPRASSVVPLPSSLFRNVLCAIDFSAASMRALEYATTIAQEAGGRLVVMHVVELLPEDVGLESSVETQRTVADYLASARADSLAKLEGAVPPDVRQYCEVETVMASGKPYREILREAERRHSDLLVVGVHGRNPLELLFFGSTTQQVVRRALCPVLTARPETK